MTADNDLKPVRDVAKNRFALLLKTIALSRGEPRLTQTEWHPTRDDHDKYEMLTAVWFDADDKNRNKGFGIDYFNEGRVRIRFWGGKLHYEIIVSTKRPDYHLLVELAIMADLLKGDLS